MLYKRAVITSDWLSAEGVSKKKFSRSEYGDYVKEQFPTATKRERTHANTKIAITDSGTRATVDLETKDAVTMPGGGISLPSFETMKLIQRGNDLLIISLDLSLRKESK